MTRLDLENVEDIVSAKAAIERNAKTGDVEAVVRQVRGERLAAATFKDIKAAVKEGINRYNSTATRERVSPLKVTADNLREFAVQTSDDTGRFMLSLDGAAIRYGRGTRNRPYEEWILRANDNDATRAAADYDIPREAVEAAIAYYRRHQDVIDARLTRHGAFFAAAS